MRIRGWVSGKAGGFERAVILIKNAAVTHGQSSALERSGKAQLYLSASLSPAGFH